MPPAIALITLLTDFGDRDYFVACMKGVILGINSHTTIIDLSHHVTPYQVEEAAYLLKASYRYFPDGTIHVAVVDPGVGSARKPLLVTTRRYHFLAPDNGLLSYALHEETDVEVRHIQNRQYRLGSDGATFDGRDLFAPAAAWLTNGRQPSSYGPLIRDPVRLPIVPPTWEGSVLVGQIVFVDRFGNLISNLTQLELKALSSKTKQNHPTFRLGDVSIKGLVESYSQGSGSAPQALINSNGQVEVFLKETGAAERLKLTRGARIDVY